MAHCTAVKLPSFDYTLPGFAVHLRTCASVRRLLALFSRYRMPCIPATMRALAAQMVCLSCLPLPFAAGAVLLPVTQAPAVRLYWC
jgi:hypothetical protein